MSPKSPLLLTVALLTTLSHAQTRIPDVIYTKSGGAAFTMDVVKPDKPNKAAVIYMVSGGWVSDHLMLKSMMPGIEKPFLDQGFTVFEVVHGAQPRYKVAEIVDQVKTAARFVNSHATEYGIDPDRVGVAGISSGGHLSLMIAGSSDTHIKAVAAIAPPTDLLNWGKPDSPFTENPILAQFLPSVGLTAESTKEDIKKQLLPLSPITYVTAQFPATLIVQGDSDVIVPPQQAQVMDKMLSDKGVDHKLEVVKGGGHDEKTFIPGLQMAINWFKEKLLK